MSYTVVGGGIGGLAAAYYLRQLPKTKRVVLLESTKRLGGWIQTTVHDDGIKHEHGPRTIRPVGPQGANTLEIAEQLGLQDDIIPIHQGHPASVNRMVLVDGKLHKLPSSVGSIFRKLDPFDKPLVLAGVKELFTGAKKCEDDSLYDFVSRRFGKDVAQYAIDPMVRGICAGNAKDISAAAFVAGPLFQMEQEEGGIVKAMLKRSMRKQPEVQESQCELVKKARGDKWNVWSLTGGLEQLVTKLHEKVRDDGIEIKTEFDIKDLGYDSRSGKATVVGRDFEMQSDHVFLTSPAPASARLLGDLAPLASRRLESIPFVTVAVVTIEFEGKVTDVDAFGFLIPSNQPEPILGAIFDTCAFPQGDRSIFTIMMGGHWFDGLFGKEAQEENIESIAVSELKRIMNITQDPVRVITKIQKDCIAQYTVGHKQRVAGAREELAKLKLPFSLTGSSYDGVGLNDSIMSARRHVERL